MNRSLPFLALLALAGGAAGLAAQERDMRAHELSLAATPTGSFAAWHGGTSAGSAIYVQKLDEAGRLSGAPFPVSDGKLLAYEPDLIDAGDRLVVAWYERDEASGALSARLAGMAANGRRLWSALLGTGPDSTRNPVVRRIGDTLHVAWIAQPTAPDDGGNGASIRHQRFSLAGEPLAPAREIGRANSDTWNLNAATCGDAFIVTYDAALESKAHELHMLVVTGEAVTHRLLSPDDGHASLYPDLQVSDTGQAAITWFDEMDGNREIYLLTAPFDWLAKGIVPAPRRISWSAGESTGAYLAWNGPTIGLAWIDEQDGRPRLFEQMFGTHGHPRGPARQLSTPAQAEERAGVPAIRAQRGGFLVAWNDYVLEGDGPHRHSSSSIARTVWFPAAQ